MTIQPYCVHLSIASPSEIEHTARRLMTIREDFLQAGKLDLWTPRPLILDSWQRCRTLAVSPSLRYAPLAVTRDTQMLILREQNEQLLRAAQPVMNRISEFLADSGHVVVLSDPHGSLLDISGNTTIRRRLARIDFVPGANWSEASAGTNAIGTALADGHVVQLMAAEHYCDGWQDLTCTAAPVRHPFTNEIMGILDVTGDYHLIRPFLTNFLASAALEIKLALQKLLTPRQPVPTSIHHYPLFRTPHGLVYGREFNRVTPPLHNPATPGVSEIDKIQWQLNLQERRASDAERLAVATGVISASLDLNVTLEKVAEQARHLLQVERADVIMFDERGGTISNHSTQHLPVLSGHMLSLLASSGAISLIQERGEPVIIDDVLNSSLLPDLTKQINTYALMLLPMVTARGVTGVLSLSRSTPHHWSIDDIRLGLAIATQSASAIENARLFATLQQHNRHIKVLNAIAQIFSTLPDPAQNLNIVLQCVIEVLGREAGAIILLDQEQDQLALAAHCKLAEKSLMILDEPVYATLMMLARRVTTHGEILTFSSSICEEPVIREGLSQAGFFQLIAVPLVTNTVILGVLLLGHDHGEALLQEDLNFYSTIGQQLGLALNNAQLQRSTREMEMLRAADQLKSGFLAAVSHDLRSPLTAIRASVESLLDTEGIQSVQGREHLLRNIAGQSHRLSQLVDQLLDLSRIEAGALALDCEWVELSVLVEDALQEFERLHDDGRIKKDLDPCLPLHYVDPDRLTQVIWNLLENVYKYAPPETPILVETRLVDDEVLISVADRGPGIPREEHLQIFQGFYRLARDQKSHIPGSGFGLAICKGIIEAHGGRIWVEDRENGGSVFFIALTPPIQEPVSCDASYLPLHA